MANKNEVKLIVTADTKGAEAGVKGLAANLKSHWLELSAMAAGAFFTIRKIYAEFAAAAEREERRMAFTNLAATFHQNADSIIADLKRMSGQSITESRAIEIAGKAMMSGFDPRAMSGLMEFAKTMSNVTGTKPADTFEDLTRAVITGQDRMLRMQGITVDFDKAQKDLAASLGGTKEQLTEQHIQYANLTEMLRAASEMTQRLGKDQVTMADDLDASATQLAESYTKLKDSFYMTFGQPIIFMLDVFAERLQRIREIAHTLYYPFGMMTKGLDWLYSAGASFGQKYLGESAPSEPAESTAYSLIGKGATSLKGLGFTFDMESNLGPGLQSLKAYTEEMKSSLGEITKSEKDLTKEVDKQIRDREQAYQNMYEALRFDTEKYYTYQKGLLEKQRDEEIAITGDLTLAWEAYYARLQALEEERILRTDDFFGGMEVYFSELEREGFSWAEGAKGMMEDAASGMSGAFQTFFQDVRAGSQGIGDSFADLGSNMLNSFSRAIDKMIADWLSFAMMTGLKSLLGSFSFGGTGESGAMAIYGHSGGYIPRFHSGGSSDEVPAILQRGEYVINRNAVDAVGRPALDRINRGDAGGSVHNYNVSISNNFLDPTGIEKYKEAQERQIHNTIKKLQHENKIR